MNIVLIPLNSGLVFTCFRIVEGIAPPAVLIPLNSGLVFTSDGYAATIEDAGS